MSQDKRADIKGGALELELFPDRSPSNTSGRGSLVGPVNQSDIRPAGPLHETGLFLAPFHTIDELFEILDERVSWQELVSDETWRWDNYDWKWNNFEPDKPLTSMSYVFKSVFDQAKQISQDFMQGKQGNQELFAEVLAAMGGNIEVVKGPFNFFKRLAIFLGANETTSEVTFPFSLRMVSGPYNSEAYGNLFKIVAAYVKISSEIQNKTCALSQLSRTLNDIVEVFGPMHKVESATRNHFYYWLKAAGVVNAACFGISIDKYIEIAIHMGDVSADDVHDMHDSFNETYEHFIAIANSAAFKDSDDVRFIQFELARYQLIQALINPPKDSRQPLAQIIRPPSSPEDRLKRMKSLEMHINDWRYTVLVRPYIDANVGGLLEWMGDISGARTAYKKALDEPGIDKHVKHDLQTRLKGLEGAA